MAFPDFFERVTQSASQLLAGYDDGDFRARLEAARVAVAYDRAAEASTEATCGLELIVRLLARLLPRLSLVSLEGGELRGRLSDLALAINPRLELHDGLDDAGSVIVIGQTAVTADTAIYLGSDRWIALLSRDGPQQSGNSAVPFGAGAAACLGVANVFRSLFGDLLENGAPDISVKLSTLNFETGARASNADLPEGGDIGHVQLVGAGAIGQATLWSLSNVAGLKGSIDVIDHERTELSNLQRYVLTTRSDDDVRKTRLAAAQFPGRSAIGITEHPVTWAGFLAARGSHHLDLVATALDSAKARVEVQGALPRRIVNAWTQPGDCGVSRHAFRGEQACLACLYLPKGMRRSESEILADELGIAERVRDVAAMLELGGLVDIDFLSVVAQRKSKDLDSLRSLLGLSLREFRQKAVCGGQLTPAGDADTTPVEVPMAFQSAMAGVMLAAEIVATAMPVRRKPVTGKSVIDLLRPAPKRLNVSILKRTDGAARCICADPDYQKAYSRKYVEQLI